MAPRPSSHVQENLSRWRRTYQGRSFGCRCCRARIRRRTQLVKNWNPKRTTIQNAIPTKMLKRRSGSEEAGVLLPHILKTGFWRPKVPRKRTTSPVQCRKTSTKRPRSISMRKPASAPMFRESHLFPYKSNTREERRELDARRDLLEFLIW